MPGVRFRSAVSPSGCLVGDRCIRWLRGCGRLLSRWLIPLRLWSRL